MKIRIIKQTVCSLGIARIDEAFELPEKEATFLVHIGKAVALEEEVVAAKPARPRRPAPVQAKKLVNKKLVKEEKEEEAETEAAE